MEIYLMWAVGWFIIVVWLLWLMAGYPIYGMLKHEKIELRKREIELELRKLKEERGNK